jgi:hypothetical protein
MDSRRAGWRIELFGGLAILKDGIPTATAQGGLSRRATKDLLALLVLEKGKGIDADTLAARLWPEKTPWCALDNLHATTSRLRGALEDGAKDILLREGPLYRIDASKVSTDVADFDRFAHTVIFADALDDKVKAALDGIDEVYRGDLLGRGGPSRNRTLSAYNQEYKQRAVGAWEVAAGLYLEQGDGASRIRAEWYLANIDRLQGLEAADALGGPKPKRRQKEQEPLLGAPRPSIKEQLAAGRQQTGKDRAAVPARTATRAQGLEV